LSSGPSHPVDRVSQISLSRRTWTALIIGFAVITLLLTLTAVTLISQRQRTVLLNRQLGSLLGEATLVLKRAGPALDAVPAHSATIASRARSAANLVTEARPLVSALSSSGLPGTVSAAGQLLQSIDQPGALEHTLSNLDMLATDANQAGLVSRLVPLVEEVPAASRLITTLLSLIGSIQSSRFVDRALGGLENLATLVRLQTRTLSTEKATLQNGRATRGITAAALTTTQQTLAIAQRILTVAEQTLSHVASLDRKTGPSPPSVPAIP
jgi:hypothetical protein